MAREALRGAVETAPALWRGAELLQLKCPCCILVRGRSPQLVADSINGCTDQAKVYAIEQGL